MDTGLRQYDVINIFYLHSSVDNLFFSFLKICVYLRPLRQKIIFNYVGVLLAENTHQKLSKKAISWLSARVSRAGLEYNTRLFKSKRELLCE